MKKTGRIFCHKFYVYKADRKIMKGFTMPESDKPITPETVTNLITLIERLTKKIQVLQILSESENTKIISDFSTTVSNDINSLNEQIKNINSAEGINNTNAISEFIVNDIEGFDNLNQDIKDKINAIIKPQTTTAANTQPAKPEEAEAEKEEPQAGGRRGKRGSAKKWRGGSTETTTTTTTQMIPIDSMDNTKIYAYGTLNVANPMTTSMNGTEVLLKSPDSFSSGSFANNINIHRDVAQIITPSLGQTGGASRKTRVRKSKK